MDSQALQDLQQQARRGVFALISTLSAISPVVLVLAMISLFMCLGYFQFAHFAHTMQSPGIAAAAAVLYQTIRFGTALASIRLFAARAWFMGAVSIGASFTLTHLEFGMVTSTASAISSNAPGAVDVNAWLIAVFTWLSFALEIFVATTLNAMFSEPGAQTKHTLQPTQQMQSTQPTQIYQASKNGHRQHAHPGGDVA
jgi:hypothetical protein